MNRPSPTAVMAVAALPVLFASTCKISALAATRTAPAIDLSRSIHSVSLLSNDAVESYGATSGNTANNSYDAAGSGAWPGKGASPARNEYAQGSNTSTAEGAASQTSVADNGVSQTSYGGVPSDATSTTTDGVVSAHNGTVKPLGWGLRGWTLLKAFLALVAVRLGNNIAGRIANLIERFLYLGVEEAIILAITTYYSGTIEWLLWMILLFLL